MSDMMTQEEAMNMSNEQAVQILIPMRNMMYDQNGCPISDAVFALDKAIDALSADRPQGKWIFKTVFPNDKSEFPMGYLVCSVCGSHHSNSTPCNYCDNCGAQMKGMDDDL